MKISVIIPTLNEQQTIRKAIESAKEAGAEEIIVGDGGSHDSTIQIASNCGVQVCFCSPGRGQQLNEAARRSTGEVLLFLHADNWLGESALEQIRVDMKSDSFVWGGFKQEIAQPGIGFRLIEIGNSLRLKFKHLAYGDQAIFVRRGAFETTGGFRAIPLMEDVCLSDSLNIIAKPLLLPGPVFVDARRWLARGLVRTTLQNWNLVRRFRRGEDVHRLAREYYGDSGSKLASAELAKLKL